MQKKSFRIKGIRFQGLGDVFVARQGEVTKIRKEIADGLVLFESIPNCCGSVIAWFNCCHTGSIPNGMCCSENVRCKDGVVCWQKGGVYLLWLQECHSAFAHIVP